MRMVRRPFLAFSLLSLLLGAFSPSSGALADNGVEINQFLKDLQDNRLPVELFRLDEDSPPQVGLARPLTSAPLEFSQGCCGDEVRAKLRKALLGSSLSPPPPFRGELPPLRAFKPDYCVFYRNEQRQIRNLWISTSQLRMVYFASTGAHRTDQPQDQSTINESKLGEVRQSLQRLADIATLTPMTAYPAVREILKIIAKRPLGFEVMSIDPTKAETVFGQKRWKVLGKISLSLAPEDRSDRIRVRAAINAALDHAWVKTRGEREPRTGGRDGRTSAFVPQSDNHIYTAHTFTPRLAISARVPKGDGSGTEEQCLLLMSFECQLLELYVDGSFKGCCALADVVLPGSTGLGKEIKTDQFINDLLVAAGKPLKPKSTSSGN